MGHRVLSRKKALLVWGELRLIEAIKSNWGDSNSWVNLNSCDVLGSAIIPNDEEMRQEVMATVKKIIATSLAVQSEINPLNPIISPKNMVTHSKCSANAVASPPFDKHFY